MIYFLFSLASLGSNGHGHVYISESLTSSQNQLFGEIIKIKMLRKWKFTWMHNGQIYLYEVENTRIYGLDTKEDLAEFC